MKKIRKEDYYILAVFLMDYHSGQGSRGYRLLSLLRPKNFTESLCQEARETDLYDYLVNVYGNNV